MSDAAERPDLPRDPQSPGPRDAAPSPDRTDRTVREDAAARDQGPKPRPDADAWATAAAEDLAAERARRRARSGPPPGSAAEELRRLLDTVADKLSGLPGAAGPLFGMAAQGAAQQVVRQVVQQAKNAVEPVIERNPGVFDHLAAAGSELLAAYRSAVSGQEQRWTAGPKPQDPTAQNPKAQNPEAQKTPAPGTRSGGEDAGGAPAPEDHDRGDGRPPAPDSAAPGEHPRHQGNDSPGKPRDRRDEGPGRTEHIDLD
jgi:hypothetical protein